MPKDKNCDILGLRKMNNMNKACNMKLVGKLINDEDGLWCKVLCNKYNISSIVDYSSKMTNSKLWKDIIKLKPKILGHASWIIRDRESINPWSYCWIVNERSINDMRLKVPQELQNAKLKELVGEDGS